MLYPIWLVPIWISPWEARTTGSLILRSLLVQSARAAENGQYWEPLLSWLWAPSRANHPRGQGQGRCSASHLGRSPQELRWLFLQRADSGCGRSYGGLRLGCLVRLDSAPHTHPPSKKKIIQLLPEIFSNGNCLLPSNCFLVLLLAVKLQALVISAIAWQLSARGRTQFSLCWHWFCCWNITRISLLTIAGKAVIQTEGRRKTQFLSGCF